MKLKKNEPLSRHTTFRIGGPAKYFIEAKTAEELALALDFARENKLKTFFLGKGSNVLFSDKGFEGVVIKPAFSRVVIKNETMIAEAGASLHKIVNLAMNHSLSGLEGVVGIPGSVGGAVAMNAGVGERALGDLVIRVWGLGTRGLVKTFTKKRCQFGYRKSIFQKGKWVILKVELGLKKGDKQVIRQTIKEMWKKRLEKQPYDMPSAGSVFKNPKGDFAGRLIEAAGCKRMEVGDAQVSEKHANFIVNLGKAKAWQVKKLMDIVKIKVQKKFKIALQPEIKLVE
jgi:UDP-N-acetylmuramate dehydrogenase